MSAITSGLTSRLDAVLLFGCSLSWLLLPTADCLLACWELEVGFELIGFLDAVFFELKELIALLGFEFCVGLVFPFPVLVVEPPTG